MRQKKHRKATPADIANLRAYIGEMERKYKMTASSLKSELEAGTIVEEMEHVEWLMMDELLRRYDNSKQRESDHEKH